MKRYRNADTLHKIHVRHKNKRGDPRPPGMTLSLVNATSQWSYWAGWTMLWGHPYRRRVSNNPDDYIWESNTDNLGRNEADNKLYLELGLLIIHEGPGPQWMRRQYQGPIDLLPTMREFLEAGTSEEKMLSLKELLTAYPDVQ